MAKVVKKKADCGIGGPIGTQMDVFPFSPSGWFRMDCNSATLAGRSLPTLWAIDNPDANNPAKNNQGQGHVSQGGQSACIALCYKCLK